MARFLNPELSFGTIHVKKIPTISRLGPPRSTYFHLKRDQPDYHLTLAIAAGTAGRAYNQRRTIAVDLNAVTLADLHLSPEEAAQIWPEVQCVLSIPMVDDDGKTGGVVTFDSTLPIQETGFDYLMIQTYLETCAALLADAF